MLRFVVRRLLLLIPILIGLSLLVFLWIRALPGSPAESLLGERATEESIAGFVTYRLDDPFYAQYWRYLQTILDGDLGTSISSRRRSPRRFREVPATVELAFAAMLFATLIGIPLGFLAAKRHGSATDHASLFLSLIGVSIPIFFLALILKRAFAVSLGWLPASAGRTCSSTPSTRRTSTSSTASSPELAGVVDAVQHLILPAIALGSIPLAIIARITRASVLDVQNEATSAPRVRRASPAPRSIAATYSATRCCRSRRSSAFRSVSCFPARSSRRPVFPSRGSAPGCSRPSSAATTPVIQGGVLFVAVVVVVVNLIVDLSYGLLNPRIRRRGARDRSSSSKDASSSSSRRVAACGATRSARSSAIPAIVGFVLVGSLVFVAILPAAGALRPDRPEPGAGRGRLLPRPLPRAPPRGRRSRAG